MSEHYVRWGRNDGKGGATEESFETAQEVNDFADQLRDELSDAWYVTVQHPFEFPPGVEVKRYHTRGQCGDMCMGHPS